MNRLPEGLRLYAGNSLLVDMSSTNYSLATAVPFKKVCSGVSPIASMKAVKNKVEQMALVLRCCGMVWLW